MSYARIPIVSTHDASGEGGRASGPATGAIDDCDALTGYAQTRSYRDAGDAPSHNHSIEICSRCHKPFLDRDTMLRWSIRQHCLS